MNVLVDVYVAGDPKPQGSLRSFKHSKTGRVVTPQSSKVIDWRKQMAAVVQLESKAFIETGPVGLSLDFVLPRPQSAKRRMTPTQLAVKPPDLDKLVRSACDGLTKILFTDDKQIVDLKATKRVAVEGQRPGVLVRMWEVDREH